MLWKEVVLISFLLGLTGCRTSPVSGIGEDPRCDIAFEDTKSDPSLREVFFASLGQCDRVVRQSKESGRILKILYAPDSVRIRKELAEGYGALGYTPAEVSLFSDVTISGSIETHGTAMAQISSTAFGFFATRLPVYILAFETLYTWSPDFNKHDLETVLLHELQHAWDWHDGMTVANLAIGNREVAGETAGIEWTVQMLELRAVYRELDAAFEPKARVDSFHISEAWFASRAGSYAMHWRKVDSLARTDLEIAAAAAQKQEYRGILPEVRGDSLLLRFDRYGRGLTAVFQAGPSPKSGGQDGPLSTHAFTGWKGSIE